MNDGLRINGVSYGKQYLTKVDTAVGGVDFYEGESSSPGYLEAKSWIDSVVNGTELVVKPEQALCVTRILEAIYTSAKTGKPVYFDD